jgi:mono/diheme cytochrome c family protein
MTFAHRLAALTLVAAAAAPALASAATPQALYMDNCSACHQANGKGVKGAFPSLAGSPLVQGDAKAVTAVVPAFKDDLNDADLAAILTYVRSSWGNTAAAVAAKDVAATRKR